jgi:TP901-1 family phage major tail protein
MTAQRGKDLLLKIDSDGAGNFVSVAGLRARAVSFKAAVVETTSLGSQGQWRELLGGAGIKAAKLSGGGIFKDAPSDELVRGCFFNGEIRNWRAVIPDFGVVSGPFLISMLEFSGSQDGELAFDIALESAGELVFSPV